MVSHRALQSWGLYFFCNDLPPAFRTSRLTFANDTSIQCSSSSVVDIEHSLQIDLNAVQPWMNANKLKLNLAF